MPSYFMTCRSPNDDGTFGAGIADPRYLVIPDGETVPHMKFESPSTGPQATRGTQWARQLLDSLPPPAGQAGGGGRSTRNILFFVHGFNQTPQEALAHHRLVAAGLASAGWAGRVVSFDWPSDGNSLAYVQDTQLARGSAGKLVQGGIGLFVTLSSANQAPEGCDVAVHVLGHSMGAFVVREAFDYADYDKPARDVNWQVNQLVFIAADISAGCMKAGNALTVGLYGHAGRVTSYSNPHDDALQVSNAKRAFTSARLGRIGLPDEAPDLACNIDGGDAWLEYDKANPNGGIVAEHSFWLTSAAFYADLKLTLEGRIDRNAIPTRIPIRPNRLALKTAALQGLTSPVVG